MSTLETTSGGGQQSTIPPGSPPYSDTTIPRVVPTLTVMFFTALAVYSTRMFVRIRSYGNFGWDDAVISLAVVRVIGTP
jgi:hypothetical protein